MPHTCQNLIIHCLDFRLQEAIYQYLREQNLLGKADIISLAGAARDLVVPEESVDKDYFLRQIDISYKLHQVKKIFLINHTDCGAYGGSESFFSYENEVARHTEDLKEAKELLLDRYSGIEVILLLAHLKEGKINFEPVA